MTKIAILDYVGFCRENSNVTRNVVKWDYLDTFKHCEPVFYGSPEIEGGKKSEERHGADTNQKKT